MNPSLKELQTRRDKLAAERHRLKVEAADAQRALAECEKRLRLVQEALEATSKRDLVVSEHAILRYIERAPLDRVNIQEIKMWIFQQVAPYVDRLGSGKYPLDHGLRAVVRDRVVVTVE